MKNQEFGAFYGSVGSLRSQNAGRGIDIKENVSNSRWEVGNSLGLGGISADLCQVLEEQEGPEPGGVPSLLYPRLAAAVFIRALNSKSKQGQRSRCMRHSLISPELTILFLFLHLS